MLDSGTGDLLTFSCLRRLVAVSLVGGISRERASRLYFWAEKIFAELLYAVNPDQHIRPHLIRAALRETNPQAPLAHHSSLP
jgi:hypothetical protein